MGGSEEGIGEIETGTVEISIIILVILNKMVHLCREPFTLLRKTW